MELVKDELGIKRRMGAVDSFYDLVAKSDHSKAGNFLDTAFNDQAALDWEINVSLQEDIKPLHFSAARVEEKVLIVGSTSYEHTLSYMEELMKLSNEQINDLRRRIKSDFEQKKLETEELYEELTQLNNDLSNAQRKIEKKNAELERLNKVKDEFLGMAAHDLRNPLSVMFSLSDLLLDEDGDPLTEEQRELIEQIQESSEFMLKLVEDLLEVNRIEAGKLSLSIEETNLKTLLERIVHMNEGLARKKDIDLVLKVSEDIPAIEIDAHKLEQVFNNLISNAVKYSYPGSNVRIFLQKKGDEVRIGVEDEGQGIPEDEQSKLFEPFTTTSAEATGGETSTGLGLTITKKIVEGHNGSIEVESTVGEGSTFTVHLPLEQ